MKKILISGGWGYGNIGDNAILAAFLNAASPHFSDSDWKILSYDQTEIEVNHGIKAEISIHRLIENRKILPQRLARILPVRRMKLEHIVKFASRELCQIGDADILVMCGGGYFNGAWPSMADAQYALIRAAKERGTKTMILGQSLGPFSETEIQGELARHLKMVDVVAVRDQISFEICKSVLGDVDNLHLTADLANLLPVGFSGKNLVANDRPKLGLMVQYPRAKHSKNNLMSRNRKQSRENYFNEIVSAVTRFVCNTAFDVVVIPSTSWDRGACKVIHALLLAQGVQATYKEPQVVTDFIAECQGVSMMLSTNMHPLIIAATAAVPVVALSYHYKTDHFMSELGLSDYVRDIDDFSADILMDLLTTAWQKRDQIAELIQKNHIRLKASAQVNIDLFAAMVAS